jgi:hypothetical protein
MARALWQTLLNTSRSLSLDQASFESAYPADPPKSFGLRTLYNDDPFAKVE